VKMWTGMNWVIKGSWRNSDKPSCSRIIENFLLSQILNHGTGHVIIHVHTLPAVDWDHHYWHMIWGFVCNQVSVGATAILHTEHLAMKALSHELHSCRLTAQTLIHEAPVITTMHYQLHGAFDKTMQV
jgi:hypothetical protein